MRKITKYFVFLAALSFLVCCFKEAQAQIVLTTGNYRVVVIDKAQQRLGIAELDANPNRVQNWIYIKHNTEIMKQLHSDADGNEFRYDKVNWSKFFGEIKKGDLVKVHGGRDWDRSIDAKKLWY
ncbi:MAG: hypothetical protein ACI38Q_05255 [Candidatus Bruticola sp.]